MRKLLIILLIIMLIAAFASFAAALRRKRKRHADRLSAAAILLREDILDIRLKRGRNNCENRYMPVLEMSWKDGGKNKSYVFNPEKPVTIGRDISRNKICIRRDTVSSEHCRIVMSEGQLILSDLNSLNGTYLKRGLNRYRVSDSVYIFSGDEIEVGGLRIKLDMFMYDTEYIS